MRLRPAIIALFAAPLVLAAAPARQAPGLGWPEFDARVADAKSAMMGEPQKALEAADAAIAVAASRPADPRRALAAATGGWLKGEALIRLNRTGQAAPVIDTALDLARTAAPGQKLEGDLLKARGTLAATLGRVQPALIDFQQAFKTFQKADAPRSEAIVLQDIGAIYSDARDYDRMARYYRQSAEIFKDDPAVALAAHNNLGNAYRELGRLSDAKHEFGLALALARGMGSAGLVVRVLPNLAAAKVRSGDLAGAEADIGEALRLAAADPSARAWSASVWGVKAQLEAGRGRLREAARALDATFAGEDLNKTALPFREFHETAWRVFSRLGDAPDALKHLAAFKRLDDQARELAASTNAALIGAQFDFANQDLKIARLRAGQLQRDIEMASAKARAQTLLTAVLVAAATLVSGLLLAGFIGMRRSRNAVRSANVRLETTNAALEHALRAKTEFLATTSHEIRTPLNGILGMTQVLLADRSVTSDLRGRIEVVHGAGETMRALVDDLLDVAKMETGRVAITRGEVDLPALLEETVRLWRGPAEARRLNLTLEAQDLPQWILEDGARLRQVLVNLLSNAIKFTESGSVALCAGVEGGDLVLSVTDTGIGVAEADQQRIFDAFTQVDGGVTRRYGGTGLGLAICRDVAAALGGRIELRSRLGDGAVFTLRLPLQIAQRVDTPSAAESRPQPRSLAEAHLLVMEPNPLTRAMLRALLAPEAARVVAVGTLAEGEAVMESDRFDHVLAAGEIFGSALPGVPEGCRRLMLASGGRSSISLLLSNATPDLEAAAKAAGAADTIARPVSAADLVATMRARCAPAASKANDVQLAA